MTVYWWHLYLLALAAIRLTSASPAPDYKLIFNVKRGTINGGCAAYAENLPYIFADAAVLTRIALDYARGHVRDPRHRSYLAGFFKIEKFEETSKPMKTVIETLESVELFLYGQMPRSWVSTWGHGNKKPRLYCGGGWLKSTLCE